MQIFVGNEKAKTKKSSNAEPQVIIDLCS